MTQRTNHQPVAELGAPIFDWKDHSRFVEVVPVRTGWLVAWGAYADLGATRMLAGGKVYRDLQGVQRRIKHAVVELTGNRAEAEDAVKQFQLLGLKERIDLAIPPPL